MGTDIHHCFQAKINGEWTIIPNNYSGNRHYNLFAYLAGVRNGFGFAGCPLHQPIIPIAEPRGFPPDWFYNDEVPMPNEKESLWLGDHSFSWLTADEILSYQYKTIWHTGIVAKEFFETWDGYTPPNSYCGGVSGPNINVADSPINVNNNTTHVRIYWKQEPNFAYFLDEVKRLKAEYGEVRMVFGFDS